MKLKLYFFLLIGLSHFLSFSQSATHLNFDGSNDNVNLGNTINTTLSGVNTFTVEALVRPETISGLGVIAGNYNGGGYQFLLRRDGNNFIFFINDGVGGPKGVVFQGAVLNTWTHVAGVWDGSEIRMYIDGTLAASTAAVGPGFPSSNELTRLGFNSINEIFNGDIDEVRIWTTVRTQNEIDSNKNTELFGSETGLLAYYNFNQGIAGGDNTGETTLNDNTTNGYNGILTNFTLTGSESNWLDGSPTPQQDPATHLNFDGIDDQVNLGPSLSTELATLNTITVEAMVRPTSITGNNGCIVGNYAYPTDNGQLQLLLRRDGSNYVLYLDDGTGLKAVSAANAVQLNTWQHVVGTWDGSSMKIYIDGVLQNTTTGVTGSSFTTLNNSFVIGYSLAAGGEPFTGDIEEVRIWSTARSENEISGSKNCELQGNEAGLMAYYNFNQGVDEEDNTAIITLTDVTANANDGTLTNFALTGSASNFLAGSPVTTGSIIPSVATITTPVVYNQNETGTALTATTGTNGTGLLWYTTEAGGTGSTIAPTPSTLTVGDVSYWVSSTNANGCESERIEIVVTVNAVTPATHLDFVGALSNYVLVSNNISSSTFTLEAYIKTSTNSPTGTFAYQGAGIIDSDVAGNANDFIFSILNNKLSFWDGSGNENVTGTTDLTDGDWHHVSVVREPGVGIKLYVDGVIDAQSSSVGTAVLNANNNIFLGRNAPVNRFFNGEIDEVRFWNIARTEIELLSNMSCELVGDETDLIAYYKFNQGNNTLDNTAITTLADATTNANDGTLLNFTLTGSTSNWLAGSPVITGSIVPSDPTVTTPIVYDQNDTATALTATMGANGTSLLWYTVASGGTGETTAPTPSTVTLGDTSYWVSSTNANGCESERIEIIVTVEEVLSIGESQLLNSIRVYPNPTNSLLTVSNILKSDLQVSVYDINGRLLLNKNLEQESNTIDVSGLSNGIYLLKLKSEFGEISKRVIKE